MNIPTNFATSTFLVTYYKIKSVKNGIFTEKITEEFDDELVARCYFAALKEDLLPVYMAEIKNNKKVIYARENKEYFANKKYLPFFMAFSSHEGPKNDQFDLLKLIVEEAQTHYASWASTRLKQSFMILYNA